MAAARKHRLIHQLVARALLCSALLGFLLAVVQLRLEISEIHHTLADENSELLQMLATPARAQLLGDQHNPQPFEVILRHPHVLGIQLIDPSGQVLIRLQKPPQPAGLLEPLLPDMPTQTLDLQENGQPLGLLELSLDKAVLHQLLLERSRQILLISLMQQLLLTALLLWIGHRMFTHPLRELTAQLQDVNPELPGSRLIRRPHDHESDELGQLADHINRLLLNLKQSDRLLTQTEDQLLYMSRTDQLTGLPNRNLLPVQLAQLLGEAARNQQLLAVFCLDIDGFQRINERFGYAIGDLLLTQIAGRLHGFGLHGNCLARTGGDQFVLVLGNLLGTENAAHQAREVLNLLARPFLTGQHEITLHTTLGISLYPEHGEHPQELLQRAEQAMTLAKQEQRGHFRFYVASIDQQLRLQREMEQALRLAVQQNELELYYQPQYCYQRRCIVAAEVLLRWNSPLYGLVMPDQFIPLAERSELINQISDWVLEQACRQLQHWQAAGVLQRLAVNLSTRQLHDRQLPERIRQLLQRYQLPSHSLELEITESLLMQDIDYAARQLYSLRQAGVLLAIDDFGTGYSSLAYLKTLPLDKLKIDKSFVRNLPDDQDDACIVRTIIQLGQHLHMQVLAEGVETEAQEDFLSQSHCQEGQGYRYGRPLAQTDFVALLASTPFSEPCRQQAKAHG